MAPPNNDRILNNLINSLQTGNEKDRLYAIEELCEMPNEKSITALVEALVDLNTDIRTTAEKLLGEINSDWKNAPQSEKAIPVLISKLKSSTPDVWKTASRWLLQLHPITLSRLVDAVANPLNDEIQWKSIQIIRQIKGDVSEAVPALIAALENNKITIRESAIKALTEIESQAPEIMEALSPFLDDGASSIRLQTVKAFSKFGKRAEPYSRALVKRLLDKEATVRIAAAKTLAAVGQGTIPDLLDLIHQRAELRSMEIDRLQKTKGDLFKGVDMETFSREPYKAIQNVNWHFNDILEDLNRIDTGILHAIKVLADPNVQSTKAIDPLVLALKDPNVEVRKTALSSIGAIGEEAKETLPELLQLFEGAGITDYELIVKSLNNIKSDWAELEDAQPFLEHLIACLGSSQEVKLRALLALKAMDGEVVQTLIKNLDNKDRIIREEVILLLGVLGSHAKEALPILNMIAEKDDNRLIRGAAEEVVRKIGFGR